MSDLLQQGVAWLDGQRHAHMTQSVTYQRGADSVVLLATVGRTEFEQADEYGVVQITETRDYLIRPSDLVLDLQQVLPQRGDQVIETDGVNTFVYEVITPGRNEPCWRWSDRYRTTMRVHTKLIDQQ